MLLMSFMISSFTRIDVVYVKDKHISIEELWPFD